MDLCVTPTSRPLEYNLEGKQYMPQGTSPRVLLTELQLDRNIANLVLDNPDSDYQ